MPLIAGETEIPVVAFFGTKGGVGKTTIMDKFATIVSRSPGTPNILLVDFDVYHRGLTILRSSDRGANHRTIHEYVGHPDLAFAGAMDVTITVDQSVGRHYLIPAARSSASGKYETVATVSTEGLRERIVGLLEVACIQHLIDLVLIDCGPIVDKLTATATVLADQAFIIGQNEPITFAALQGYPAEIREFFQEFEAETVRVILNKVRGHVTQGRGIFAAIPFTLEEIDYSEGLEGVDEMRLVLLDRCVYEIVRLSLEREYDHLVPGPEAALMPHQRAAIDAIDRYRVSNWYQQRAWRWAWLVAGGVVLLAGVCAQYLYSPDTDSANAESYRWMPYVAWGLMVAGSASILASARGVWDWWQARLLVQVKANRGYAGVLALLDQERGRKRFAYAMKTAPKIDGGDSC